MRIKTDENVHPDVATMLRAHRHDALTVWDQSLRGTSDGNLAAICAREQRVLFTLDLDFADIQVYPPERFAGIVVLRLRNQSRDALLRCAERLLPLLAEAILVGQLWVVDETLVRMRGGDPPP